MDIKVIYKGDKYYPDFLSHLDNAPEKLFCIGDVALLKERAVGVVGARKCTEYGKQVAHKIGEILSQNEVVTVSGLALGIDGFAHRGALAKDGKTIAVVGNGPDICYPAYNRKIYEEICKKGLVLSEYEPGTKAQPWHFPKRNQIISALSEAIVVVEAGTNSGSLITAECAAEQGKEILAVPGNITSVHSLGCNKLIADGATILTSVEDILRAININPQMTKEKIESLGADEIKVLNILLEKGEVTLEEMSRILGEDSVKVSGIVAVLELKGLVSYYLGKIFIAKF